MRVQKEQFCKRQSVRSCRIKIDPKIRKHFKANVVQVMSKSNGSIINKLVIQPSLGSVRHR